MEGEADGVSNGAAPVKKSETRSLKMTVVGDGTVGKTCLLISYTENSFPEEYVPTVFDNHAKNMVVDGVDYSLTLWDTAGQEEYEKLRPLSYPKTDCFILCFALDNPSSFANIELKWVPELRHHCPKAKIILVGLNLINHDDDGTKKDMVEEGTRRVTEQEGRRLKSKIKADAYLECSSKTQEGLDKVFEEAVRSVVDKPKRRICCLL